MVAGEEAGKEVVAGEDVAARAGTDDGSGAKSDVDGEVVAKDVAMSAPLALSMASEATAPAEVIVGGEAQEGVATEGGAAPQLPHTPAPPAAPPAAPPLAASPATTMMPS